MLDTLRPSRLKLVHILSVPAAIAVLLAALFPTRELTAVATFAPGNLALLVANGTTSNVTGSIVAIDAASPGAALLTIALPDPTNATDSYRMSASATSTGYVSLSSDRTLLTVTGHNSTTAGTTNANTLNPRGVYTVNAGGTVVKQATYTGTSGNQTRSATSLDNAHWFIADQGGLYTNGSSGSSPSGNFRAAKSFGGAVYLSQASSTTTNFQVVTVSAPSGGSLLPLSGLSANASLQDYYLVQSGDHGSTYDILYILSATSNTAGTIAKYSLVDTNANSVFGDIGDLWTVNGSYTTTFGGFGLAAEHAGAGANLYVSTGLGALAANSVLKVTDLAGYNATINVNTANNVTLYTAAAGTVIKGLDFAPVSATPTVSLSVNANSAGETTPATSITVTATASSAVNGDKTVNIGVSGTNITSGDYTLSNNVITILNGQTSGSVSFSVVDDPDIEGTETATLTLSSPSSGLALGSPITQNVIIADNDFPLIPVVSLSVSTTSASEAAATAVTVTATATSAVSGNETVSLGVSGTSITASDYTLSNNVITIPGGQMSGSVTFTVVDDMDVEGAETATLTIGNPSTGITLGSPTTQNITITDNDTPPLCSVDHTAINVVQGSGAASSMTTQTVTVRGVVVGDYEGASPALRGFYIQDLPTDDDGNPATSEGIFVFEANNANTVSLGQVLQVTGVVSEFSGLTEMTGATIENCGTTAAPAPVDVTLPVPAAVGGVPYLERFEGMLVRFHQTLSVTEHFELGRFGEILMSSGGRRPQPTSIALPGAPAQAQQAANDLNVIRLDDSASNQNPDPITFGRNGNPLSASNTLRGGDTATDVVGVMTFQFAEYVLEPINAFGGGVPNFQPANPRPTTPPSVGGRLKVVGMNVLNYFLTLDTGGSPCGPLSSKQACRGANNATELLRQQQKLNAALVKLNADIFGFAELENTQTVSTGADVNPLADIIGRLNTSLGSAVYGYIDTGVIGTDTIRVGIAYKIASVAPVGSFLVDNKPIHSRPPLAQAFTETATGERFSVVVNHFKSKGSCPASGADADQGDGQGCWNATRTQQATALVGFINGTVIAATGDPDVLLVGDFNAYAKEDPIRTLETAGFTNLVARYLGAAAYSYVFDGQWGYLDHGLASSSLLSQVTNAGDYHINADEPIELDYNTEFKSAGQIASMFAADEYRISDHDPVVVGLALAPTPKAVIDHYSVQAGTSRTVIAAQGVLANDTGGPLAVAGTTNTAHGTLTVNPDGSFTYTPNPGFVGTDTFDYLATNASRRYTLQVLGTNLPPLATIDGVNLTAGAFGSALVPSPTEAGVFYGLTDRGPNVDGPGGTKVEPLPTFVPSIGKFRLAGSQVVLEQVIPLKAPDDTTFYNGQVHTQATSGETITDLNGNVLPASPFGYDPEGLVVLPDGTFWVSDEYGPFITHFDATGKQDARLSPFDLSLPAELRNRVVNRGMEGLTITPDGSTLVGMMQSALQQPDLPGSVNAKKLTAVRIVTYQLAAPHLVHEYLYLLDDPATTDTAVSEITALTNTQFLVDERDADYPPAAYKKLYLIDISGATDVGPSSPLPGYDGAVGGLIVAGKTIEHLLHNGGTEMDTATSASTLAANGITPVSKVLNTDVGALLDGVDAQGRVFSHDKLEGVAVLNGGATIVVSNDSDFGIDGVTNAAPPFQLHAKVSPVTGQQDDGELLVIDLIRSTASVIIEVQDTTRPDTTLTSMPGNPTNSTAAGFMFTGSDGAGSGVTGFECKLDTDAFLNCSTGVVYSVADGSHTFAVRAVDGAGNVDDTPATYSWTVDTVPPDTTIDSGPANPTADTTASFTFHGTDAGTGVARLECALDGAPFGVCISGVNYSGLAVGAHTFAVRAVDAAGNVDDIPATYLWTIGKATATVTLSNLTQTYTGSPLTPAATTVPPGLAIVWTNAPQTNAGSYAVTATVNDPNYQGAASGTFVIQRAPAIVTFGPAPAPTFPGPNFTVAATTTNTDSGALTFSYVSGPCALVSGATFSPSGVGTCRVQANGAATTNFLAGSAQQNVAIGAAAIAINNLPAGPVYGGNFVPAYTYAGNGKTSTTSSTQGVCTVSGKGTVTFVGVGTCTLTAHATATASSPAVTGAAQSFAVGQASATISVRKIPGGSSAKKGGSFTPTYDYDGDGVPSVTSSTPTTCTVSGNVVQFAGSGTCTLTAHATAGINFAASVGTPQSFTIK